MGDDDEAKGKGKGEGGRGKERTQLKFSPLRGPENISQYIVDRGTETGTRKRGSASVG